jgi:hypothetical protein
VDEQVAAEFQSEYPSAIAVRFALGSKDPVIEFDYADYRERIDVVAMQRLQSFENLPHALRAPLSCDEDAGVEN